MTRVSVARSIPPWLAAVVQDFELRGNRLVSVDDFLQARPDLDRATARLGLAYLVKRGWLQPIGVRGVYEFIPGAAAGPYPSSDPWLTLRAVLRQRPGQFHAGANSAAWLLGYAQRSPDQHIVVALSNHSVPRSLRAAYHVLETMPAPAHGFVDGVPVPTPPELFVEVAQLTPRLQLDAAQGWIRRILDDVTPEEVAALLRDRGAATRARAGYFADTCGAAILADAIAPLTVAGAGPFYTGPQRERGPFAARWRVYDTGHVYPS